MHYCAQCTTGYNSRVVFTCRKIQAVQESTIAQTVCSMMFIVYIEVFSILLISPACFTNIIHMIATPI